MQTAFEVKDSQVNHPLPYYSEDNMVNGEISGHGCAKCGSRVIIKLYMIRRKKHVAICKDCKSTAIVPACEECGSLDIVREEKQAQIVCRGCGLVIDEPPHYVGGGIRISN